MWCMLLDRPFVSGVHQEDVNKDGDHTADWQVEQHQARNAGVEVVAFCEHHRVCLEEQVDVPVDETHVRSDSDKHGLMDQDDKWLEEDILQSFGERDMGQLEGRDIALILGLVAQALGLLHQKYGPTEKSSVLTSLESLWF